MELDELRSDWQSLSGKEQGSKPAGLPATGGHNRSPISLMLRNLRFEALFVVLVYGFVIGFYFFSFRGMMREVSWFTLFIGALFFFYYLGKTRLLRSLETMDGSLQANIGSKLDALSRYVRFYVWAGTLLGPVTMAFLGWLAWYKIPEISPDNPFFISDRNPLWRVALNWLAISVPLTVGLYFINRWYVDMLYGRHLRHLRRIHEEMREDLSPNLQP
jgi:hypothetical protein